MYLSWVSQWNKQTIIEHRNNMYCISKNMGATVEQDEIDKFYLTINVIRVDYEVTQWNKQKIH